MKHLFGRIDSWLQKIFVVELPENIGRNISKQELIDLYFSCGKEGDVFRREVRQLLEQRLPGKVREAEINCCLEWVAAVSKRRR
jgi:hypothetical protein